MRRSQQHIRKHGNDWLGGLLLLILLVFGQFIPQTVVSAQQQADEAKFADVLSVKVSGKSGAYSFSVEVASPDTGCAQYADWWEVLTEEGELVYRRILSHSHTAEQPFVRSGGPVATEAETILIVRAHMHPEGYGGKAMKGTAAAGFEAIEFEAEFATDVETRPPQPDGCAF